MKQALTILLSLIFSSSLFAFDIDFAAPTNLLSKLNEIKIPSPVPATMHFLPDKNQKEWTIMVFMNGKNNLSNYAFKDLNEMEIVGSLPNVNIVVEVGRIEYNVTPYPYYPDSPYPYNPWQPGIHPHWPPMETYLTEQDLTSPTKADDWTGMRRYFITKDTDTSTVTSPILETLSGDMGDWKHLAEFGKWAKKNFPAKRYMLVVWNHGDGWKKPNTVSNLRGISIDDETGNEISTINLARAIKEIGGVDIYASDACLMQMAEVAYELQNWAPVIIGSEETEPADGWPYDKILTQLSRYQYLRYDWIAKAITKNYAEDYSSKGKQVTQSSIKARGLVYVRDMINDWSRLAISSGEKGTFKQVLRETTSFGDSSSKDLIHFLTLVSQKTQSEKLRQKGTEIINYISQELIISNHTTGERYKNAFGLAIYLPSYIYTDEYQKLRWAKDTNWDEFLQWFLAKEQE